ncbi:MAG: glycosyltransferase family 2 protein [Lachnospiraceae bacterium]|nr:glycosyltransferase family 2 protein [Lachnospiraceae bacterium]
MVKSTIVIPNYNGIRYIQACLESLYGGTTKEIEVIVVDNASTDGSMELVRDRFPQVRLIVNQENTGFSYAVNQGIQASTTPYVILLNNDTQAELSFVHELEKVMDNDRGKRIFSAGAKLVSLYDKDKTDDAGDYYCALGWAFARGKGKPPENYDQDCDIFASCAGAAIYRRELLDENKVGLFDVEHFAYFEDTDIGYRAKIHGYRNRFVANSIVYHAGSAASGSRYNAFKTALASRNSIYIIYKNMPFLQMIINLPFLLAGFLIKTLFFMKKGMGKDYVSGLIKGIKLSASPAGRRHKQKFHVRNIKNYILIQLLLWRNMLRILE